jgi:hypothetical protein
VGMSPQGEQMSWNEMACGYHAASLGSGLFPEQMSWNETACGYHTASLGSGLFPEQTRQHVGITPPRWALARSWSKRPVGINGSGSSMATCEAACGFHAASLGSGSFME